MGDTWWNRAAYASCVSSGCWSWTPYDAGWDRASALGADLQGDTELRAIVAMERDLVPVPGWARQVVVVAIREVGPCGHYTFPLSFLEAVDAIGARCAPARVHGCFVVGPVRRRRVEELIGCLDAWRAPQDAVAAATGPGEVVAASGAAGRDPRPISDGLRAALGERTVLKAALVERIAGQLRVNLREALWCGPAPAGCGAPSAAPASLGGLDARIHGLTPHAAWFLQVIDECLWLCAPKLFRYLEKLLWCVGRERPVIDLPSWPLADPEPVPGYLHCGDTWPEPAAAARWWAAYLAALDGWWQGEPPGSALARDIAVRLGAPDAAARWLVRLLAHRARMLERYGGIITRLLAPPAGARTGAGTLPVEP